MTITTLPYETLADSRDRAAWLDGYWRPVRDGDHVARALYRSHYSRRRYRDGRKPSLFVGPGQKSVFLGLDGSALWAWRKFKSDGGQTGVNNAIFINRGLRLSSDLIREAVALAGIRWPGERLYTYIDPKATAKRRSKRHAPGHCYLMAGWLPAEPEWTKGGLRILEYVP